MILTYHLKERQRLHLRLLIEMPLLKLLKTLLLNYAIVPFYIK
jgi:hypothetical protein